MELIILFGEICAVSIW